MPSRREFVQHTAVAALTAFAAIPSVQAGTAKTKSKPAANGVRIQSVMRRDETILRHGGMCDIFPMTWMADGRQFASFSDGQGWSTAPTKSYNTQGIWINDGPLNATFEELPGYPARIFPAQTDDFAKYYGFGALAVEDRLYHYLCSTEAVGQVWNGTKLIYSPDGGRTWHNQNGSAPVVWETYADRSRKSLLFFEEPQRAFSLMSVLQMGKNYEENRDGFVYGYGTNGNEDGAINQLVMFRVPKRRVLDREAYEFFGGLISKDKAQWVKDINVRAVVHTFPRGWASPPPGVVQSWVPSIAYVAPLGVYLMASSGVGCTNAQCDWFNKPKPSYLGLWTAPNPWGPWNQIHEETAWTPDNDAGALCYSPQIAPKWIAPDGKSFWLVWTDFKGVMGTQKKKRTEFLEQELKSLSEADRRRVEYQMTRQDMPGYSFNTQRFDLTLA